MLIDTVPVTLVTLPEGETAIEPDAVGVTNADPFTPVAMESEGEPEGSEPDLLPEDDVYAIDPLGEDTIEPGNEEVALIDEVTLMVGDDEELPLDDGSGLSDRPPVIMEGEPMGPLTLADGVGTLAVGDTEAEGVMLIDGPTVTVVVVVPLVRVLTTVVSS